MYTKGMETPKIIAALGSKAPRFQEQIAVLEAGLAAKKIWNVEYTDAKFIIGRNEEDAMKVAAEPCYELIRDRAYTIVNPVVYDISGYMDHNRAAKLLRNLEKWGKKNTVPAAIAEYMEYLRELVQIGILIKAVKPFIVKGRRPVEKTEQQLRDELSNTGVCAICANRQKLDDGVNMVMHGYQMSEYNHAGYRVGKCFGVGYKPYELSNEANVAFAPVLENHRIALATAIKTWKSGKITSVEVTKDKYEGGRRVEYQVTYTLAENPVEFNREKESRIARLEGQLRLVKHDIEINTAKIKNWTLQPLAYGSKAAI